MSTVIDLDKTLQERHRRATARRNARYKFEYGLEPDKTLIVVCACGAETFHLSLQGPRCTRCERVAKNYTPTA